MRHVFETMGTVASIELPAGYAGCVPAIENGFARVDARFSLYRPDSELSRIAAGHLRLPEASAELIASYTRALGWRDGTAGAFTPHRPDGVLDLNGIVKAEAIEQAGVILDAAGCPSFTINVGGDILARYPGAQSEPIGIIDPHRRDALLCSLVLREGRRAIATSGSAERGDHIWRGGSFTPADFVQVTVIADDIVTADVVATAIVAGGRETLDELTDRFSIDVLTVDRQGAMLATPGARAALATGASAHTTARRFG